jgi:hypothetical protein
MEHYPGAGDVGEVLWQRYVQREGDEVEVATAA